MSASREVEREFVVPNELGLHARPAGRFVAVAGRFEAEISVGCRGEGVSGKSLISLLTRGASQGAPLRIRAVGIDAQAAVEALGHVIETLGEEVAKASSR